MNDTFLLYFTKHAKKEQMLRKILQGFPGNTQKQGYSMAGVSLEYLEYFFRNTCYGKALFNEIFLKIF